MASSLIKLSNVPLHLTPNQSLTRHWNNATPPWAVWYIQAIPLISSFKGVAGNQSVEVEVTRVWRRLNYTPTNSDVDPKEFEHEIYFVVKNLSAKEVDVDLYASIIS